MHQTIAKQSGPHQNRAATMYSSLRENLVNTVYKSWLETGFAWEQYNPEIGAGQRTQHFTGWTSLVVKIMAMPQLGFANASMFTRGHVKFLSLNGISFARPVAIGSILRLRSQIMYTTASQHKPKKLPLQGRHFCYIIMPYFSTFLMAFMWRNAVVIQLCGCLCSELIDWCISQANTNIVSAARHLGSCLGELIAFLRIDFPRDSKFSGAFRRSDCIIFARFGLVSNKGCLFLV